MRYEFEVSTDSGSLVLFDPSAIPAGPELRSPFDAAEALERASQSGAVCPIPTDSAGPLLLHLYVDEPMPEGLRSLAWFEWEDPELSVPSGELRIAGLEHAFGGPGPADPLRRPATGSLAVAPGTYRLRVARVEYPEGAVPRAFRAEAPAAEYLAWVSMKLLIPLAIAAWIGLVVRFFTTVRVPLPEWSAGALGFFFILPFAVRRLDVFATARARYARLEREHPSIVIRLDPRTAADHPPPARLLGS